jgi:hypothetical protein
VEARDLAAAPSLGRSPTGTVFFDSDMAGDIIEVRRYYSWTWDGSASRMFRVFRRLLVFVLNLIIMRFDTQFYV